MGAKTARLEIQVCKGCGWSDKKIRKTLETLAAEHPDELRVVPVDCLDECSDDPVVKVGKKCLAPAKPKKVEKAVVKALEKRRS